MRLSARWGEAGSRSLLKFVSDRAGDCPQAWREGQHPAPAELLAAGKLRVSHEIVRNSPVMQIAATLDKETRAEERARKRKEFRASTTDVYTSAWCFVSASFNGLTGNS